MQINALHNSKRKKAQLLFLINGIEKQLILLNKSIEIFKLNKEKMANQCLTVENTIASLFDNLDKMLIKFESMNLHKNLVTADWKTVFDIIDEESLLDLKSECNKTWEIVKTQYNAFNLLCGNFETQMNVFFNNMKEEVVDRLDQNVTTNVHTLLEKEEQFKQFYFEYDEIITKFDTKMNNLNDFLNSLFKIYNSFCNFEKIFPIIDDEMERRDAMKSKKDELITNFKNEFARMEADEKERCEKFIENYSEAIPETLLDLIQKSTSQNPGGVSEGSFK